MPPKKDKKAAADEDLRIVDGQNRGVVENDYLYFCRQLGVPVHEGLVQAIRGRELGEEEEPPEGYESTFEVLPIDGEREAIRPGVARAFAQGVLSRDICDIPVPFLHSELFRALKVKAGLEGMEMGDGDGGGWAAVQVPLALVEPAQGGWLLVPRGGS